MLQHVIMKKCKFKLTKKNLKIIIKIKVVFEIRLSLIF